MLALALLAFVSLAISLALTPRLRDNFLGRGWVDLPDGARKLHARPVPRLGGVPVALAYVAALALVAWLPLPGAEVLRRQAPRLAALIPAAVLIFAAGLVDDLRGIRPWAKLSVQLAAATWVALLGVRIDTVAGHPLAPALGVPLTVLWLAWCSNAFNLIDGLDGLAAGLGLFASLILAAGGLFHDDLSLALVTVPLAGALTGFLRYNFNPASIFLGDCGSLLIGFLLGAYGVIWSQKSAAALGITAPVLAIAVPSLDVALAIARRYLRRRPIFAADRGHLHHRLLDLGLTPRRAALTLYALGGVYASISLAASAFRNEYSGLVLVICCLVTWVGLHDLKYREFAEVLRLFRRGTVHELLAARLRFGPLAAALADPATARPAFAAARDAGIRRVELRFGEERITLAGAGPPPGPEWHVTFPLGPGSEIALAGPARSLQPLAVAALLEVLGRQLAETAAVPDPPAVAEAAQPLERDVLAASQT